MLEVEGIDVSYGSLNVLKNVSIDVENNEQWVFLVQTVTVRPLC